MTAVQPKPTSVGETFDSLSPATDEVLIYNLEGTKVGALKPAPPNDLGGASALALSNRKLYVVSAFSDRVQTIDLPAK